MAEANTTRLDEVVQHLRAIFPAFDHHVMASVAVARMAEAQEFNMDQVIGGSIDDLLAIQASKEINDPQNDPNIPDVVQLPRAEVAQNPINQRGQPFVVDLTNRMPQVIDRIRSPDRKRRRRRSSNTHLGSSASSNMTGSTNNSIIIDPDISNLQDPFQVNDSVNADSLIVQSDSDSDDIDDNKATALVESEDDQSIEGEEEVAEYDDVDNDSLQLGDEDDEEDEDSDRTQEMEPFLNSDEEDENNDEDEEEENEDGGESEDDEVGVEALDDASRHTESQDSNDSLPDLTGPAVPYPGRPFNILPLEPDLYLAPPKGDFLYVRTPPDDNLLPQPLARQARADVLCIRTPPDDAPHKAQAARGPAAVPTVNAAPQGAQPKPTARPAPAAAAGAPPRAAGGAPPAPERFVPPGAMPLPALHPVPNAPKDPTLDLGGVLAAHEEGPPIQQRLPDLDVILADIPPIAPVGNQVDVQVVNEQPDVAVIGVDPPPIPAKTEAEIFQEKVDDVVKMFPDVEPEYVINTMRRFEVNQVEFMVNHILENPGYPRRQKKVVQQKPKKIEKNINYFDPSRIKENKHHMIYERQCHTKLLGDFRRVSARDLKKLESLLNFNYALIYKALATAKIPNGIDITKSSSYGESSSPTSASVFIVNVINPDGSAFPYHCTPLKCGRTNQQCQLPGPICDELQAELDFIHKEMREETENKDRKVAELMNETEYETTGQLIECGCCYCEIPFDQMIQCFEGCLFCRDCLTNYAKEAIYGQGKAKLECMSDGCSSTFPKDQMERALPKEMMDKFDERVKEEVLNLADIEGLVRCPHCDFAGVLPPETKVFSCQNPECMKETCRHCKEDWPGEHFGVPCSELEKKDETKMRKKYEEQMTEAKVRKCHKCKAAFMKTEGCNRMTCRCGATLCYICREPNISYQHFCGHPRNPEEKSCKKCNKCSLWTNPEEDDERAVQEIKAKAQEERKEKGFDETKLIGAPEEKKKSPKQRPHAEAPPAPPAAAAMGAAGGAAPHPVAAHHHNQHMQYQQAQAARQRHAHHRRRRHHEHHHHHHGRHVPERPPIPAPPRYIQNWNNNDEGNGGYQMMYHQGQQEAVDNYEGNHIGAQQIAQLQHYQQQMDRMLHAMNWWD